MVSIVIFSTGPKHSKFDSWTSENANHTKSTLFKFEIMFMRLHNSFLRPVSSFHGAGVHQTLFIHFAR